MARTGYGKHATQVDTNTYPDDPNVPIGSDEWNAEPSDSGMLGFNAETIASATSITPSNTVLNISGSTNVSTIAQGNTNEYDLLYIFTSGTVTLEHNTGNLQLISGANKDLSTTVPTILIRKGTDWIEYGGGGNVTGTVMSGHIIPDTDDTYDIGSAEYKIRDMYVSDNSLWIGDNHKVDIQGGKMKFKKRKSSSVPAVVSSGGGNEAGAKSHSGKGTLEAIKLNEWVAYARSLGGSLANAKTNDIFRADQSDDWDTDEASITSEQASAIVANTAKTGITTSQASAITANTAKVTNATHTGDVTGSGALTIASGAVDLAHLSASGTKDSSTYLRGDNTFSTVSGIPSGVILMWSGLIANIPSGWVICDGNNSTPNLLSKFIRNVATASTEAGTTGGADSVTLTTAQLASHTHTQNAHTHTQNAHTHTQDAHGHSGSTNSTGSHTHDYYLGSTGAGGVMAQGSGSAYWGGVDTSSSGSHSHTVTVSNSTAVNQSTTAVNQSTTAVNQSTGSGSSHENRPSFYELIYIMKT